MRTMLWLAAVGLAMGLGFARPAQATSMRCGRKLVDRGDRSHEVRSLCGEPDARDSRTESRTVRKVVHVPCGPQGKGRCAQVVERTVNVQVEVWTYDEGPRRLIRYLTFENGVLVDIDTGSHGTR